ncbi:MAG TPA: ATP-dependent 6-phosphofructokinase [Actinomycetota bacterium]|nr:ATP-dependent 6-phosphofructokinase [Actinomycetota bacterium]
MRLGVLTGGGDCPGLNAVIRAVVRRGIRAHGMEFVGIQDGWRGLLDDATQPLGIAETTGILPRGGTILGSSGANPYRFEDGPAKVVATLERHGLDGLVAIGGEGTLGAAARLAEEGLKVVGVPKTIDNDLGGTDVTVGFHTAVQVATDAIDRLHSTAESHDRVMLVEVMGRNAGWIAVYAGMAGGADAIMIPEQPFDLDTGCDHLRHRHASRSSFSIVVVAEGAVPKEGTLELPEPPVDENGFPRLGGVAYHLAPEIEKRTGFQTRVTILGHVQRGGSPVAFDRVLGTRFGIAAADLAAAGGWGRMVARKAQDIGDVTLAEAVAQRNLLTPELYREAEVFFG